MKYPKHLQSVLHSITFKITFSYLSFFIVILLVFGSLFTRQYIDSLTKQDLEQQQNDLAQVADYFKDLFLNINIITIGFSLNRTGKLSVAQMLLEDNGSNIYDEQISRYLQGIIASNYHILDVLIMDQNLEQKHFFSSSANRSLNPWHDFHKDKLFEQLNQKNNPSIIKPFEGVNYVIGEHSPIISSMGPILFLNNNEVIISGYYIINISRMTILEALHNKTNILTDSIFVLNNQGQIIHNIKSEKIGKLFPYWDIILKSNSFSLLVNKHLNIIFTNISNEQLYVVNLINLQRQISGIKTVFSYFIYLFGISLVISIFFSIIIARYFGRRVTELLNFINKIQSGNLDISIQSTSKDELGSLAESLNDMCQLLKLHIDREYNLKLKSATAELKALYSQINPHFLYNTLENIRMSSIIHEDETTAELISILGRIMRWNVRKKGLLIPLHEEMDYLKDFLVLCTFRFEGRLKTNFIIDEQSKKCFIPALIIQPIVENALSHGIADKIDGGAIEIRTKIKDDMIYITIHDDGKGMSQESINELFKIQDKEPLENNEKIGIINTYYHRQYRLFLFVKY